MKNLLKRLFQKKTLVPLNFKQKDCPKISPGDTLIGTLEEQAHDYIAGFCGKNPTIQKGATTKWKVIEILNHGAILIQSGNNKTILDNLTWDDGNRTSIKQSLSRSEMKIRWFIQSWK